MLHCNTLAGTPSEFDMQNKSNDRKPRERVIKSTPIVGPMTPIRRFVTLSEIVLQLVMDNEPCVVRDAKTGEDITAASCSRSFWKKRRGLPMFTAPVLANIIRFTGTPCKVSWVVTLKRISRP